MKFLEKNLGSNNHGHFYLFHIHNKTAGYYYYGNHATRSQQQRKGKGLAVNSKNKETSDTAQGEINSERKAACKQLTEAQEQ
jgi:hypothetical protein